MYGSLWDLCSLGRLVLNGGLVFTCLVKPFCLSDGQISSPRVKQSELGPPGPLGPWPNLFLAGTPPRFLLGC